MLLCAILNGPKKVGLPRTYEYTDYNMCGVDNNRCSLFISETRVIGGSGCTTFDKNVVGITPTDEGD